MEAKTKPKSAGVSDDGYIPLDGSWVAELEDAKDEMDELVAAKAKKKKTLRGEALQVYLRLCRSYGKLRQWNELSDAAQKGLDVCSTYAATPSSASRISEWKARFESYKKKSREEQSGKSLVDDPKCAQLFEKVITGEANLNYVAYPHVAFTDSNVLQFAALAGDMRFLEALVARGAALDAPFLPVRAVVPSDATGLLMVCVNLASAERNRPLRAYTKTTREELDRSTECAMQLVRLGAELARKLNLGNAPRTLVSEAFRSSCFDGKTVLELAKMTSRVALVELMEQHLSYTPEERADVVHCRCGSRLPWKACHGTGIGQPPHYYVAPKWGLCYRVPVQEHGFGAL
jgi:hypothetical protein